MVYELTVTIRQQRHNQTILVGIRCVAQIFKCFSRNGRKSVTFLEFCHIQSKIVCLVGKIVKNSYAFFFIASRSKIDTPPPLKTPQLYLYSCLKIYFKT